MNIYHTLFVFFIYAFLGWCLEVAYHALKSGEFVNRGFLNGPLCPIYGVGMFLILQILSGLMDNKILLFFGAILLTTTLELVVGWILFKIFNMRWWDYTDMPFNIGGYVCPLFSIYWGIGCIIVIDYINPLVNDFINLIPHSLGKIILIIVTVTFITDGVATVRTILKMNKTLKKVDELGQKIKEASNEIGQGITNTTLKTRENVNEFTKDRKADSDKVKLKLDKLKVERDKLLDKNIFGKERMLRAFPKLEHKNYNNALIEWQNKFSLKSKKKENID